MSKELLTANQMRAQAALTNLYFMKRLRLDSERREDLESEAVNTLFDCYQLSKGLIGTYEHRDNSKAPLLPDVISSARSIFNMFQEAVEDVRDARCRRGESDTMPPPVHDSDGPPRLVDNKGNAVPPSILN